MNALVYFCHVVKIQFPFKHFFSLFNKVKFKKNYSSKPCGKLQNRSCLVWLLWTNGKIQLQFLYLNPNLKLNWMKFCFDTLFKCNFDETFGNWWENWWRIHDNTKKKISQLDCYNVYGFAYQFTLMWRCLKCGSCWVVFIVNEFPRLKKN